MRHLQIYQYITDIVQRGSIRKSAEHFHITPSALTRKIQDFELELGASIFERLPHGMRLNAAGELLLKHIQYQNADFERLCAQIADLEGVRRGHISLASAQAFIDHILADEIAIYRSQYPQVTFSVNVRDNIQGLKALINYEVDLALLIDPPASFDIQELLVKKQPLCVVVNKSHPLAKKDIVQLKDCFQYPIAMPSSLFAIRTILDKAFYQQQLQPKIIIESDSLEFLRSFTIRESVITFQPYSGVPRIDHRICSVPISTADIDPVRVVLCQRKERSLSVAAEKFIIQLEEHLLDL